MKKYAALICACLFVIGSLLLNAQLINALNQQVAENVDLRSWNTRLDRRLHWMQAPKSIDVDNVAMAFHIEGTPPPVVAGLIFCENGPKFLETGSLDKSDFVAKNLPLKYWSTVDGARTLNRLLWDWLLETPEGKQAQKSFFLYAAKPYTSLSPKEQQTWAKNMQAAIKRFSKEIKFSEEKYMIQPMRTPTAK